MGGREGQRLVGKSAGCCAQSPAVDCRGRLVLAARLARLRTLLLFPPPALILVDFLTSVSPPSAGSTSCCLLGAFVCVCCSLCRALGLLLRFPSPPHPRLRLSLRSRYRQCSVPPPFLSTMLIRCLTPLPPALWCLAILFSSQLVVFPLQPTPSDHTSLPSLPSSPRRWPPTSNFSSSAPASLVPRPRSRSSRKAAGTSGSSTRCVCLPPSPLELPLTGSCVLFRPSSNPPSMLHLLISTRFFGRVTMPTMRCLAFRSKPFTSGKNQSGRERTIPQYVLPFGPCYLPVPLQTQRA